MKTLLAFLLSSTLVLGATQTLDGWMFIPPVPEAVNSDPTFDDTVIDLNADGEEGCFVVRAPKAGEIDRVVFRTGTVITGGTLTVRLETVNTSGEPSGTLLDTTTNVDVTIDAADDDTQHEATLTASATVTQGQIFAVKFSVGAGPDIQVSAFADVNSGFPYVGFNGGAWSFSDSAPCVGFRYDDATYPAVIGSWPFGDMLGTGVDFNSSDTPDERGIIFQLPVPVTVVGCWVWMDLDNDATLKLYDSDGSTVLTSVSLDSNQRAVGGTGGDIHLIQFAEQTLSKDTNYRLTLVPGASDITSHEFSVDTAAWMDLFPGGTAWQLTTRADAGIWAQTATNRPFMGLILQAFDDGAGAGGGGGSWTYAQ